MKKNFFPTNFKVFSLSKWNVAFTSISFIGFVSLPIQLPFPSDFTLSKTILPIIVLSSDAIIFPFQCSLPILTTSMVEFAKSFAIQFPSKLLFSFCTNEEFKKKLTSKWLLLSYTYFLICFFIHPYS